MKLTSRRAKAENAVIAAAKALVKDWGWDDEFDPNNCPGCPTCRIVIAVRRLRKLESKG